MYVSLGNNLEASISNILCQAGEQCDVSKSKISSSDLTQRDLLIQKKITKLRVKSVFTANLYSASIEVVVEDIICRTKENLSSCKNVKACDKRHPKVCRKFNSVKGCTSTNCAYNHIESNKSLTTDLIKIMENKLLEI